MLMASGCLGGTWPLGMEAPRVIVCVQCRPVLIAAPIELVRFGGRDTARLEKCELRRC